MAAAAGLWKPEWTLGIDPNPSPSCRATSETSSPAFNSSSRWGRWEPRAAWGRVVPKWSPLAGFSPPGPLHRGCPHPWLPSCTPVFPSETAGCTALVPSQPSARGSPVLSPAGTLPPAGTKNRVFCQGAPEVPGSGQGPTCVPLSPPCTTHAGRAGPMAGQGQHHPPPGGLIPGSGLQLTCDRRPQASWLKTTQSPLTAARSEEPVVGREGDDSQGLCQRLSLCHVSRPVCGLQSRPLWPRGLPRVSRLPLTRTLVLGFRPQLETFNLTPPAKTFFPNRVPGSHCPGALVSWGSHGSARAERAGAAGAPWVLVHSPSLSVLT